VTRVVTATFQRQDQADRAVEALGRAGYPPEHIRSIGGEPPPRTEAVTRLTWADPGATLAGIIGGVGGAVIAALMAIDVVPDLGLGLRGAPMLGAAIRGGVIGAAMGALFGFILGMGIWDTDGELSSTGSSGGYEVQVEVPDGDRAAREIFERILPGASSMRDRTTD
jgi:hypothetical protein